METNEFTSIDQINKKIAELMHAKGRLKAEADDLARTKASELYSGKWIKTYSFCDCENYYFVKEVESVVESFTDQLKPRFKCQCERQFSFTYFDGLHIYSEPKAEILELDDKTVILSSDEIKAVLERFRQATESKLADIETNFV